jgi:hypothetical protein
MTLGAGAFDDARVERLLMLSGKRVRLLAGDRLLRVRAALIAENSRLARAARRVPAPSAQPLANATQAARLYTLPPYAPAALRALAAGAFSAALVCGYIYFGGARASHTGTLSGDAIILESRTGLFGWTWQMARGKQSMTDAVLRLGDEIVASTPLTLKLKDGVEIVAQTGAHLSIHASGDGLTLHTGVISGVIAPANGRGAAFTISHIAGTAVIKEARFDADANERVLNVIVHQGGAVVRNDRQQIEVVTGEQTRVEPGEALVAGLRTPRVIMPESARRELISASPTALFDARISPNGTLIALDQNGAEYGRYQANSSGLVRGEITFDKPGRLALRFLQEDSNGARRSALSGSVEIEYDPAALMLSVNRAYRDRERNQIVIAGVTKPGARITVNGADVPVDAGGRFETRIAAQAALRAIEIVATGDAGAPMRVMQLVE